MEMSESKTDGWLYCFSNPVMPGLFKIGFTERTPEKRRNELQTSGVPVPFKIEFARFVNNPMYLEKNIHKLFDKSRIAPNREFFEAPLDEVRCAFELMVGVWWVEKRVEEEEAKGETEILNSNDRCSGCSRWQFGKWKPGCRRRGGEECFTDGQELRHKTAGREDAWHFIFRKGKSHPFIYNGSEFKTMNQLTELHYKTSRPERGYTNNTWMECECKVDGKWISTYSLPAL